MIPLTGHACQKKITQTCMISRTHFDGAREINVLLLATMEISIHLGCRCVISHPKILKIVRSRLTADRVLEYMNVQRRGVTLLLIPFSRGRNPNTQRHRALRSTHTVQSTIALWYTHHAERGGNVCHIHLALDTQRDIPSLSTLENTTTVVLTRRLRSAHGKSLQ